MKKMHLGILIMVISAITFSVAIILMKVIPELTTMYPEHVAIWRFIIGAPAFWILSQLHSRQKSVEESPPWRFIATGMVFSVANFCAVFALARLPSSIYVIILNLSPALVVLYALFTGRSVPKLCWLGLPLTMIGLILTMYEFGSNLTINPEGLIISLINAVAFSSFMILSEKVFTQKKNRIIGTGWVMAGAMLTGLITIPFLGIGFPESAIGWLLILTLGVFGGAVPIYTMNVGLQLMGAARGSVITSLIPILTVLFSTMFLNEILSIQQWIGGALVVIAVVLLQRSPDHVNKPHKLPLHLAE